MPRDHSDGASHSLVYGFDNYTQTGIFTTKINNQWTIQVGLSNGTDVALWQKDPGNQPTGTVMIQWVSPDQTDSIYAGDNAFNNGEFGYNNLQQIVGTWTHKSNDRIYTATEAPLHVHVRRQDASDRSSALPKRFISGAARLRTGTGHSQLHDVPSRTERVSHFAK